MSRPFSKESNSDSHSIDDPHTAQDEGNILYKAKTYWSGQGDNDLTVHPNDALEPKTPNCPKPGYIYAFNRRSSLQGFVPKSLLKREICGAHSSGTADTSSPVDSRTNALSDRRVRFQPPLKANLDEAKSFFPANRDNKTGRSLSQTENASEQVDEGADEKSEGCAKLNESFQKIDYLNLCNASMRNPAPKSGSQSKVDNSPYVDLNRGMIPKGLPSYPKFKPPFSSNSRAEQTSEYVEHCPSYEFSTKASRPAKLYVSGDFKYYSSISTPSVSSSSSQSSATFPIIQPIGIPTADSDSDSPYVQFSVPNFSVDQSSAENTSSTVATSGSGSSNEHQLTSIYCITPILCRHCNDYIWGTGIVGYRCDSKCFFFSYITLA